MSTAQRTGFFIILLVRGQKLAVARKITLHRLWLLVLMEGSKISDHLENEYEIQTWKLPELRAWIILERIMQ